MTLNPQIAAEIRETLSEQEETFETWRKRTGLVLGPLVAVSIYLVDMPSFVAAWFGVGSPIKGLVKLKNTSPIEKA
jgi:hypothetical protein